AAGTPWDGLRPGPRSTPTRVGGRRLPLASFDSATGSRASETATSTPSASSPLTVTPLRVTCRAYRSRCSRYAVQRRLSVDLEIRGGGAIGDPRSDWTLTSTLTERVDHAHGPIHPVGLKVLGIDPVEAVDLGIRPHVRVEPVQIVRGCTTERHAQDLFVG